MWHLKYLYDRVRYWWLRRTRKSGLLAVPGQPGLFYDAQETRYVNIRDF